MKFMTFYCHIMFLNHLNSGGLLWFLQFIHLNQFYHETQHIHITVSQSI